MPKFSRPFKPDIVVESKTGEVWIHGVVNKHLIPVADREFRPDAEEIAAKDPEKFVYTTAYVKPGEGKNIQRRK